MSWNLDEHREAFKYLMEPLSRRPLTVPDRTVLIPVYLGRDESHCCNANVFKLNGEDYCDQCRFPSAE